MAERITYLPDGTVDVEVELPAWFIDPILNDPSQNISAVINKLLEDYAERKKLHTGI